MPNRVIVTDLAQTTLAAAFTVGVSTTVTVLTGKGALFGAPSVSKPVRFGLFKVSALNAVGQLTDTTQYAVYRATTRAGDVLSGLTFESGTQQSFAIGDVIGVMVFAQTYADLDTDLALVEATLALATFRVSSYVSAARLAGTGAGTDDDWPAFMACVDAAIAAKAGDVEVDLPLWFLGGSVLGDWNASTLGVSNLTIRGHGDSTPITIHATGAIPFRMSNFNLLQFIGLDFVGYPMNVDCVTLIQAHDCKHVIIERGNFTSILASAAVLELAGNGVCQVRNCQFGSVETSGPTGVIYGSGCDLHVKGCYTLDFGYSKGVEYSAKAGATPTIYYRSNATVAGGLSGALHVEDLTNDEGRSWTVDVDRTDVLLPRIRSVILRNVRVNISQSGGFKIAGADTVIIEDCEFAFHNILIGIRLRDTRFASIQRTRGGTGDTCVVDADATVSLVQMLDCNGLTKSAGWAPLRSITRLDNVSTDTGLPTGIPKIVGGAFVTAIENTDFAPAVNPIFTGTITGLRVDYTDGSNPTSLVAYGAAQVGVRQASTARAYYSGGSQAEFCLDARGNAADQRIFQFAATGGHTIFRTVNDAFGAVVWSFLDLNHATGALAIGNGGTPLKSILSATAVLDFPSVAAGGQQELTISVTGAATGDSVFLGKTAALETGLIATARVSAADTVTARVSNITGAPIDPASGTYRATVIKF